MSSASKPFVEEPVWEKRQGKDTMERTRNIGLDSRIYRNAARLPPVNKDVQANFDNYIHRTGAQALQIKLSEERELELEREEHAKKTLTVCRILRRKVQVNELEAGELSITIDQEWDTNAWPDDMVEAGCDALCLIFYDPDSTAPVERKDRAVIMLQKLINRHSVAESYIRRNIETMIGQAANRLIKNGKSKGLLDLLYILSGCRERFQNELSMYNFTGRAHEMLLLEARLAAILIQHTFRAMMFRRRDSNYVSTPLLDKFGSAREMKRLRYSVVNARGRDLRKKWQLMHLLHQSQEMRLIVGGMRGPVHVGVEYTKLALQVILQLVSEKALDKAAANREDVVRSNGCIILSTFLSCTHGPFAVLAAQILMQVSKAADSLPFMLHTGCVRACYKFIVYLKANKIAVADTLSGKLSTQGKLAEEQKFLLIDCLLMISKLGIHAAGVFRARSEYNYVRAAAADTERVNYLTMLQINYSMLTPKLVMDLLGYRPLIHELSLLVIETKHVNTMRFVLRSLLALCSSECLAAVLKESQALGGGLTIRLVELLEEQDIVVSSVSLSIFMQLCTLDSGRAGLLQSNIPKYLAPITPYTPNHTRKPYQRALLTSACLCRQLEWRAYEPQDLPIFMAEPENLRKAIYLDILKTIKNVNVETAEMMTIADLVIIPIDLAAALEMSKAAEVVSARDLADFVCHPNELTYFEELPWDESGAGCEILEGLSYHPGTALNMFSAGTVHYLGQCLYISRYLFVGNPMSERRLMIVLNAVASAANALANLAIASVGHDNNIQDIIEGVTTSDLMGAACFFMETLSVPHPTLDAALICLQEHVGLSVIHFFNSYAAMLISMGTESAATQKQLSTLAEGGKAVSGLIKALKNAHGMSSNLGDMLDQMCQLLAKLTVLKSGADLAVHEWRVFEALRIHLPSALSALGELGVMDESYRTGLGLMPPSLFHLCANMCQIEQGRANNLVDGFLRRALEILVLVRYRLESKETLSTWSTLLITRPNLPLPTPSIFRQNTVACLTFVAKIANFHNPKYGAANDVIISPNYAILDICRDILMIEECPAQDPAVVAALQVIAALSRDNVRFYDLMERIDVLGVVYQQFKFIDEMTFGSISDCVQTIFNIANGLRTPYLSEKFTSLREPLVRVTRLHPQLTQAVRDCNWAMTKATLSLGTMYAKPLEDDIEAFIRRNVPIPALSNIRCQEVQDNTMSACDDSLNMSKVVDNSSEAGVSSDNLDTTGVGTEYDVTTPGINSPTSSHHANKISDKQSDDKFAPGHIHGFNGRHGTYEACGVTSCGSLKMPYCGNQHGDFLAMTEQERSGKLRDVDHCYDSGLCEISKLSAREKGLQEKIEFTKSKHEYKNKVLVPASEYMQLGRSSTAPVALTSTVVNLPAIMPGTILKSLKLSDEPIIFSGAQTVNISKLALCRPKGNVMMSKSCDGAVVVAVTSSDHSHKDSRSNAAPHQYRLSALNKKQSQHHEEQVAHRQELQSRSAKYHAIKSLNIEDCPELMRTRPGR